MSLPIFSITENSNRRRIYYMGTVIKLEDTRKRKLNKAKIDKLVFEKGMIIGDAEFTEMEDGDILMDAISEAKCEEIDRLIHLEFLKAGYTMEELCS